MKEMHHIYLLVSILVTALEDVAIVCFSAASAASTILSVIWEDQELKPFGFYFQQKTLNWDYIQVKIWKGLKN